MTRRIAPVSHTCQREITKNNKIFLRVRLMVGYHDCMKSFSTVERICMATLSAVACFVAGYMSSGSTSEYDLRNQISQRDAQIKRLIDEKSELSERASSLVSDIAAIRRIPSQAPTSKTDDSIQPSSTSELAEPPSPPPIADPERTSAQKIVISEIGTTLVDDHGTSSKYLTVALKAKLTNNNSSIVAVKLKFVLLSDEGFELDSELVYEAVYIKPGASEIVSTTSMLTKSVYERTKSVEVRIRLE